MTAAEEPSRDAAPFSDLMALHQDAIGKKTKWLAARPPFIEASRREWEDAEAAFAAALAVLAPKLAEAEGREINALSRAKRAEAKLAAFEQVVAENAELAERIARSISIFLPTNFNKLTEHERAVRLAMARGAILEVVAWVAERAAGGGG